MVNFFPSYTPSCDSAIMNMHKQCINQDKLSTDITEFF